MLIHNRKRTHSVLKKKAYNHLNIKLGWESFQFYIQTSAWFFFNLKWCMVWWWPEQKAETSNHFKMLMVLLNDGFFNKYIDCKVLHCFAETTHSCVMICVVEFMKRIIHMDVNAVALLLLVLMMQALHFAVHVKSKLFLEMFFSDLAAISCASLSECLLHVSLLPTIKHVVRNLFTYV